MLQRYQPILSLLFILILSGCYQTDSPNQEIEKLKNKFPQLTMHPANKKGDFELVRTVSFGEKPITIRLYSQADIINAPQQIVVITNATFKSYAIPFFSNVFHNYWNFPFDTRDTNKINTSFEDELNKCLNELHLNDSKSTAGDVVAELLFSVLHCKEVTITDSLNFQMIPMTDVDGFPEENSDSCFVRLKKNWESIAAEMPPNKYSIKKTSYWDQQNNRIYQFDYTNFKRKQPNRFVVKTFREDCIWHMITM